MEHEKWDIITKAKEATERALMLKAQLDAKDLTVKELQGELSEVSLVLFFMSLKSFFKSIFSRIF